MSSAPERRKFERQQTVPNRACLEWWDGQEPHTTIGHLSNISQGGAHVEVDQALPFTQSVWLRLEEPAVSDWVKASVVRAGRWSARRGLSFAEGCPLDVLWAVVLGIRLDHWV